MTLESFLQSKPESSPSLSRSQTIPCTTGSLGWVAEAPEKAEAGEASSHRNPRPLSRSTQTPTHTIKVRPIQSLLLPGLRLSFGLPPHSLLGHGVYGSSLGRRGRTPSRNPAESDLVWGPGAARAGTAQGSTFPRDITGAVQSSALQFLNPKQSPCAEAMVQQPLTPPRGGATIKEPGSAHLAPQTPALLASTAGCLLFL